MEQVRITITVEGNEQAEKVLNVIGEGEAEGELNFAFEVRTDRVEPLHRGTARRTTLADDILAMFQLDKLTE